MRGRFNPDTLSECPFCHKKPSTYKDTDRICHIDCQNLCDDKLAEECGTMSNYPGDDTWTDARRNWEHLVKEAKKKIAKGK